MSLADLVGHDDRLEGFFGGLLPGGDDVDGAPGVPEADFHLLLLDVQEGVDDGRRLEADADVLPVVVAGDGLAAPGGVAEVLAGEVDLVEGQVDLDDGGGLVGHDAHASQGVDQVVPVDGHDVRVLDGQDVLPGGVSPDHEAGREFDVAEGEPCGLGVADDGDRDVFRHGGLEDGGRLGRQDERVLLLEVRGLHPVSDELLRVRRGKERLARGEVEVDAVQHGAHLVRGDGADGLVDGGEQDVRGDGGGGGLVLLRHVELDVVAGGEGREGAFAGLPGHPDVIGRRVELEGDGASREGLHQFEEDLGRDAGGAAVVGVVRTDPEEPVGEFQEVVAEDGLDRLRRDGLRRGGEDAREGCVFDGEFHRVWVLWFNFVVNCRRKKGDPPGRPF